MFARKPDATGCDIRGGIFRVCREQLEENPQAQWMEKVKEVPR